MGYNTYKKPPIGQNLYQNTYLVFIFHLKPKTVTYVVYFDCYESWNVKDQKWHFMDQKFEKFENLSNYRNIYLKRKLRTYRIQIQSAKLTFLSIYWKKNIFSKFSPNARGPPKFFNTKFFNYFWKNVKNALLGHDKHQKKQSHEFWCK